MIPPQILVSPAPAATGTAFLEPSKCGISLLFPVSELNLVSASRRYSYRFCSACVWKKKSHQRKWPRQRSVQRGVREPYLQPGINSSVQWCPQYFPNIIFQHILRPGNQYISQCLPRNNLWIHKIQSIMYKQELPDKVTCL